MMSNESPMSTSPALSRPSGGVGRGGEDEYGAIGPKLSDARDARDLGSPDVDGRERHRDAVANLIAQGHAPQ